MTDPDDDALPRWVLGTPTRSWEWWSNAALLLVVSVGLAIGAVIVHVPPAVRVMATVVSVLITVGAIVLAWAARTAYEAQDLGASWQLHLVAVVVGTGSATAVTVLGLAAGEYVLAFAGAFSIFSARRWHIRARPRFDVVVTMWAEAVVGFGSAVALVVEVAAHRSPGASENGWFLPAALIVGCGLYLLLDRRAVRIAPER